MNKEELRREKIAARDRLTIEERRGKSETICRRILESREFKDARTVMIYKAVRGEVQLDCLEAANVLLPAPKLLVYPLCHKGGRMAAVAPGEVWKKGAFGIMEPDPEAGRTVDPREIDLVVCPCTAFDGDGNRLGMGGGYYDRFLPECVNAAVIAVAFEVQRAERVVTEEWDRGMGMVVTEGAGRM